MQLRERTGQECHTQEWSKSDNDMHPGKNKVARRKTNCKQCREGDQAPPNHPTQYYPRGTETKRAQGQQVEPSIQRTQAPSGKNGIDKIRVDFDTRHGKLVAHRGWYAVSNLS